MATETSSIELAKKQASVFCREADASVQVNALGSGNINDTFLVIAPSDTVGRFVLQKINQQVFKQPQAVIENFGKLYAHLSEKSLPIQLSRPISTRDGASYIIDEQGDYWRAVSFIGPSVTHEFAATPQMAYRAGQAVATFLSGLSDLDVEGIASVIPRFHDSNWRLGHFKKAWMDDAAGRVVHCEAEIAFVLRESSVFGEVDQAGFPQRVVHNDTKIGNLLFDPTTDNALAVIDWDTAQPGAIPSDFGDMVRTMTTTLGENDTRFEEVHLRLEWFEALAKGFVPPLQRVASRMETEGLVLGAKWIILEQMMRFLGDYLQGDTYYKTSYPEHNLVRARNQMALYRSLLKQERALEQVISSLH